MTVGVQTLGRSSHDASPTERLRDAFGNTVRQLLRLAYTPERIAEATGKTVADVRAEMRLQGL